MHHHNERPNEKGEHIFGCNKEPGKRKGMGGKMSSKDKVTSCNSKATIVGRITVRKDGKKLEIYCREANLQVGNKQKDWIFRGYGKGTGTLCQVPSDWQGYTKKEALRWQKIKRLVYDNNEWKAVVDKDLIKGLALSWILLGLEYEEKVERKEDKYRITDKGRAFVKSM